MRLNPHTVLTVIWVIAAVGVVALVIFVQVVKPGPPF